MDKAVGFTPKQRRWFLKRDGNRCMFRTFDGEKWVRCKNTKNLQVHHIIPRGWSSMHMPKNFPINGPENGVCLCPMHHVGDENIDPMFVVHPDTMEAKAVYRSGNKKAYALMGEQREILNKQGVPYWNTTFDWMFHRLVKRANDLFIVKYQYPNHAKYGQSGR